MKLQTCSACPYFYPRPPRGGRPPPTPSALIFPEIFLSTPSARRATLKRFFHGSTPPISIHALREEGDRATILCCLEPLYFYPRPPRGGRRFLPLQQHKIPRFLSTPSARRATGAGSRVQRRFMISIHALREEGDNSAGYFAGFPVNFYPRPPRGGRLQGGKFHRKGVSISIHALREEGDVLEKPLLVLKKYFYPRPPRGGRHLMKIFPRTLPNFYPRPPRGGRQ